MVIVLDRDVILARLHTSVISDTLDSLGLRHQALRSFVRPLDDGLTMFGRARTGLYASRYHVDPAVNPYAIEMALIDDLAKDEVVVLACQGPSERIAPWGELLSTAAAARGAAGCVTDGLVRDIRQIRAMQFPVFHGGIGPLDSKGRGEMIDKDVPVEVAGASVDTGDYVFGDADGVVVVPAQRAAEVFEAALAKVAAEDRTRDELRAGAKLQDVYQRYGVL